MSCSLLLFKEICRQQDTVLGRIFSCFHMVDVGSCLEGLALSPFGPLNTWGVGDLKTIVGPWAGCCIVRVPVQGQLGGVGLASAFPRMDASPGSVPALCSECPKPCYACDAVWQ